MTDKPLNTEIEAAAAEESAQPRKVSLAEAMKQKLAQKKQAQADANQQKKHQNAGNQPKMKSQNTKKINNQRKRMGV
ncbi:hypothetical protein ACFOQM_08670 [Paenibacillus sp. GCM10012307]|uniref:Uncharacterized protein n=1 Tax=Paenibacillus roseus TaxID=2798579 RepID=A0A934MQG6_9BACL|nr:hypothetical protein [Paenibacillus roseus]MBJ6361359.1 hypothetical protein [Paenibacillus roseus]